MITNIFITIMIITSIVGFDVAHAPEPEASPTTVGQAVVHVEEPPVEEVEPTPEPEETIEGYIRYKFGEHADKAFLLLSGNDYCGGENRQLNPLAVNVNRDGSRDRGIFQINSAYHPLTDEQAFDYKQNIDYAHRMFINDNYTFVRWTAGRCMGL